MSPRAAARRLAARARFLRGFTCIVYAGDGSSRAMPALMTAAEGPWLGGHKVLADAAGLAHILRGCDPKLSPTCTAPLPSLPSIAPMLAAA